MRSRVHAVVVMSWGDVESFQPARWKWGIVARGLFSVRNCDRARVPAEIVDLSQEFL